MRHRRGILAAALGIALTLGGCSPIGINQEGIVLAVGVDPAGDAMRWSFMLPNPTITPSSEASVHGHSEFYVISVEAATLSEAVRVAQGASDRDLFLGLSQVVVLSPLLPAPVVQDLLTTFVRSGRFPPRAWVTFGQPTARRLLTTTVPEESVPTVYLAAYFTCRHCHSPEAQARVWEAWDELMLPSRTAVLPVARLENGQIAVRQVALVTPRGVHVLTPEATLGWAILANRLGQGAIGIPDRPLRLSVHPVEVHAQTSAEHGRLRVRVVGVGRLEGGGVGYAGRNPKLEQAVAGRLVARCMAALDAMMRTRTDPLGLATRRSWRTGRREAPFVPVHATVQAWFRLLGGARTA